MVLKKLLVSLILKCIVVWWMLFDWFILFMFFFLDFMVWSLLYCLDCFCFCIVIGLDRGNLGGCRGNWLVLDCCWVWLDLVFVWLFWVCVWLVYWEFCCVWFSFLVYRYNWCFLFWCCWEYGFDLELWRFERIFGFFCDCWLGFWLNCNSLRLWVDWWFCLFSCYKEWICCLFFEMGGCLDCCCCWIFIDRGFCMYCWCCVGCSVWYCCFWLYRYWFSWFLIFVGCW